MTSPKKDMTTEMANEGQMYMFSSFLYLWFWFFKKRIVDKSKSIKSNFFKK